VVDTQAAPGQGATLIVESKGLIAATLSSDGERVVYAVTLQGEANSGVWLANVDGSNRHKFDWTGGWRWSPVKGNELFYIPIRASGETSSTLWSYDTTSQQASQLTDSAKLPFRFTLDEWQIAPDNKNMVYRSATDNALWLLNFR
jgi:Tol biopolymer transport system component